MDYCPNCGAKIIPGAKYCYNCGARLSKYSFSGSITEQIKLYLISFFLPPLGLLRGYPYLKESAPKLRIIGWIAIILTLISLALAVWFALGISNYINNQIQQISVLGGNFSGL